MGFGTPGDVFMAEQCTRFVEAVAAGDPDEQAERLGAIQDAFGAGGLIVAFRSVADAYGQWSGLYAALDEIRGNGGNAFAGIRAVNCQGEWVNPEEGLSEEDWLLLAATRFAVCHANDDVAGLNGIYAACAHDVAGLGVTLALMANQVYRGVPWVPVLREAAC